MAEVADVTEKGDRREIADEGDWRTRGETEMTKNGDREREREKEMAHEGESKETTEDEKCGIGTCHPQVMQRFARLIFFTLNLSFSGVCTYAISSQLMSQVMYATHRYVLFCFCFVCLKY